MNATAPAPRAREHLAVLLLLAVVALAHLHPATTSLLRWDTHQLPGDGTDATSLPYHYGVLLGHLRRAPQLLLYPGVLAAGVDPPHGALLFIPWVERLLVVLLGPWIPLELLPAALGWVLVVANGFAAWWLGRHVLRWWAPGAAALALCWAFTPYVRARLVVHLALAGTWVLPCAVAALCLLRRPGRAAGWQAAGLLFLCAMAPHYYVVMAAVLVPAWLLFLRPLSAAVLRRAGLAALPAALLVAWTALGALPPGMDAAASPVLAPNAQVNRAFLNGFGAHPVDFFTGDVKLGTRDLNPLRGALTASVRRHPVSNPHERSNGIRWTLLALAAALLARRLRAEPQDAFLRVPGVALAVVGFACALPPDVLELGGVALGPSQLVHLLVPQFRVPARFGLVVYAGVWLLAGVALQALRQRHAHLAALAAALAVVEYAPLDGLLMQPVLPARTSLYGPGRPCGRGMLIPYLSNNPPYAQALAFYGLQQSLRGSDCQLVNRSTPDPLDAALQARWGAPALLEEDGRFTAERATALAELVRCGGLDWLAFTPQVPAAWAQAVCRQLFFELLPDFACRRREPPAGGWPELLSCVP